MTPCELVRLQTERGGCAGEGNSLDYSENSNTVTDQIVACNLEEGARWEVGQYDEHVTRHDHPDTLAMRGDSIQTAEGS